MAVLRAEKAHKEGLSDTIADWDKTYKHSKKALASIKQLVEFFEGDEDARSSVNIGGTLQIVLAANAVAAGVLTPDMEAIGKSSRVLAEGILVARETFVTLASFSKRHRHRLAAGHHSIDEEKAAFVLVLAEAWVHLTARPPGKGTVSNPFLRFVKAAWRDAGHIRDENFINAMRSATRLINTSEMIAALRSFGPSWR